MSAPFMLLVAAMFMMSCAKRLKYSPGVVPHTMTGSAHRGTMMHTPLLQMSAPGIVPPTWKPSSSHRSRTGSIVALDAPPPPGFVWGYATDDVQQRMLRLGLRLAEKQTTVPSAAESATDEPEQQVSVPSVAESATYEPGQQVTVPSDAESATDEPGQQLPVPSDAERKANTTAPYSFRQPVYGNDKRHLLHDWARLYLASFAPEKLVRQGSMAWGIAAHPLTPKDWHQDKAILLTKMRDVLATNKDHELVGLIEKDFTMPWPTAIDHPMLALGIFSRSTLKDDRGRSVRKHIEEKLNEPRPGGGAIALLEKILANEPLPSGGAIDVFSIEGVAAAPGLATSCASVLMSQIDEYARQEQRIVVVPPRVYTGFDGTDLTDYYVRIGFERVEMDEGPHELVYTGTSSPVELVGQVQREFSDVATSGSAMVGLGLWTGSEPQREADEAAQRAEQEDLAREADEAAQIAEQEYLAQKKADEAARRAEQEQP